jgi:hypothetical protein
MKLGKNLVALAQALQNDADAKTDYVADARTIRMASKVDWRTGEKSDAVIEVGNMETALAPTEHCHHQIASWSGIGTRYYDKMRDDSPELLVDNVNHWLHKDSGKQVNRMVRTIERDGTQVARAFLSDRYLRLDNEHVAETSLEALQSVPELNIVSCDVTDKKLYIKAVFPRTQQDVKIGDSVQSGVIISNSEIGAGAFKVEPFWYRLWCLNGCANMIKAAGLNRRHLGGKVQSDQAGIVYQQDTIEAAAAAALLECRDAVTTFADPEYFAKQVELIRATTETEKVVSPVQAVEVLGKALGLGKREGESILERFIKGQDYTQYGMLNAVTNLANDVDDYDRATEIEFLGGKVMNLSPKQWHEVAVAA